MTESDLAIDPLHLSPIHTLREWEWFLQDTYTPIIASKMGSLFLQTNCGRIDFFDPIEARIWTIADNLSQLQEHFCQKEFIQEYFQLSYFLACQKQCAPLPEGACYSHLLPLCVGGKDMPTNIAPLHINKHLNHLGQLHAQIVDLPEGSLIQLNEESPKAIIS